MKTTQDSPENTSNVSPMVAVDTHLSLDKDIYRAEALSQLNEFKELREAARPLVEYLQRKHNPHTKAVVDSTSVEVFDALRRVNL